MPSRASIRNPVDFGASGLFFSVDTPIALSREVLSSGEVDALIVHGIGRTGMHTEDTTDEWRLFLDITKQQIQGLNALEKETGLSNEEIDAIDPLLEEALRLNGGDTEPLRKMVRSADQADCVGECLMERLRTHNRLMLQEHKQFAEVEQVASQERLMTRTRDGEQYGDLTRTETQTRSGSGSGSGGGGSKGR